MHSAQFCSHMQLLNRLPDALALSAQDVHSIPLSNDPSLGPTNVVLACFNTCIGAFARSVWPDSERPSVLTSPTSVPHMLLQSCRQLGEMCAIMRGICRLVPMSCEPSDDDDPEEDGVVTYPKPALLSALVMMAKEDPLLSMRQIPTLLHLINVVEQPVAKMQLLLHLPGLASDTSSAMLAFGLCTSLLTQSALQGTALRMLRLLCLTWPRLGRQIGQVMGQKRPPGFWGNEGTLALLIVIEEVS